MKPCAPASSPSSAPPITAGRKSGPNIVPRSARAPKALAVGDLHVENFGTWRDIEGRLDLGHQRFRRSRALPYTNDLIRLSTSALHGRAWPATNATGIDQILNGYRDALEAGGRPFALAEHHPTLRDMATARLHQPEAFLGETARAPRSGPGTAPAGALN